MTKTVDFRGLRSVLKKFDDEAWNGSVESGRWSMANGGYDCWFVLYFDGEPVLDCIAGDLSSHYGLEPKQKQRLFSIVAEVFSDNCKIKEPSL